MFTKIYLKFLWIIVFALLSTIFFKQKIYAATYVEESIIDTDTIWIKSNSPYVVNTLLVSENANLNIEPGVEVKFQEGSSLLIYGEIIARGT